MSLKDLKHENEQREEHNKAISKMTTGDILFYLSRKAKAVEDGEEYGYKFAAALKEIENAVKVVRDIILPTVLDEIDDKFEWNGLRFEKTSGGSYKYDDNSDYVRKKKEIKAIEEAMKAAYKTGKTIVDDETGEVYEPAEFKPSKTSFKISKFKV